ncbi:cytochrome b/b6 domain-containing protein [Pseudodesulfovibrio sp. zrk46]|uniref:formate dehydrogenase subunit gamma n=1 Tax=Pseudodesulfovibrio sp. zrk46 TaxID=2725288 RepID=UPI0014496343|nr:cytochrome b/b6 domain-containing protein [Pseudodesulfovibrio sp. zrk46]QJB55576.1 cytochrome b/b6 domain-containing protein [Pseudodesulfovibrio sp. zrk46]
MRLKRFTPVQKAFHILLMLSFLVQAVTGTARMYIETSWGRALASPFGGYEGSLTVHKYVGLFMLLLFLCHMVYALFIVFAEKVGGEDALWFRFNDLKQFFAHLGWMFGGKAPRFERWGYWEKFDYWAVFWGMIVLGVTGLMLYDPLSTTAYFKGWSLNVALWVHRIEACLAMLHVFVIHFAIAHLRRHNFPMDRAMFAGDTDLEAASEERPAWMARLRSEGGLEERTVSDVPVIGLLISYVIGLSVVVFGIYLVVGGLMNANLVSW